jgi:hypothetical protein
MFHGRTYSSFSNAGTGNIQFETKLAHNLSIVWYLVKNTAKILQNVYPTTFGFQDTCHRQMAKVINAQTMDTSQDRITH